MKRFTLAVGLGLIAALAATCGGGNQQQAPAAGSEPAASAPAPASGAAQPAEIELTSGADAVKTGENTFEVMVMQGGQPVTDADVSIAFFMPAMPAMKMAEMKSNVALKHEGAGRYRGTGNVMMVGSWDTTVMAMRGGQEIANKKLTVTVNK